MVYALRSRIEDPLNERIADGDEAVLVGLLDNDSDMLIIIGAECYDDSRRVIHPRGARDRIDKLKKLERWKVKRKPEVWVLAESYKQHDGNLIDAIRFFRYHLDRLDVYPGELIDEIITEKTTK